MPDAGAEQGAAGLEARLGVECIASLERSRHPLTTYSLLALFEVLCALLLALFYHDDPVTQMAVCGGSLLLFGCAALLPVLYYSQLQIALAFTLQSESTLAAPGLSQPLSSRAFWRSAFSVRPLSLETTGMRNLRLGLLLVCGLLILLPLDTVWQWGRYALAELLVLNVDNYGWFNVVWINTLGCILLLLVPLLLSLWLGWSICVLPLFAALRELVISALHQHSLAAGRGELTSKPVQDVRLLRARGEFKVMLNFMQGVRRSLSRRSLRR